MIVQKTQVLEKELEIQKTIRAEVVNIFFLFLPNVDWIMKVASVINNYVHYAEEKTSKTIP